MKPGRTPLPDVDVAAVEAYWAACLDAGVVDAAATYADADCFGDSAELADELLELITDGPKRATAGTVADYDAAGIQHPKVGDYFIATDGSGAPSALLRTTEIRIGPLSSVDDQFAWDEGEGDRSRAYWLHAHTECFLRAYERLGLTFRDDIEVVFERFELLRTT